MSQSFSVDDFRSSFKTGIASPTKFAFRFSGTPPCLQTSGTLFNDLSMHVHRCALPDQSIVTANWQVHGGGPVVKYPYENSTQDITLEIVSSADHWEKQLFALWQKKIINYGILSKGSDFLVGYYKDYVVNAEIDVFTQQGNLSHTIIIENAWPIQIAPVEMSWDSQNQYINLLVTLTFAYWSYKEENLITSTPINKLYTSSGSITI